MKNLLLILILLMVDFSAPLYDPPSWDFDAQLQNYFVAETDKIKRRTEMELSQIKEGSTYQEQLRRELQDMLGLLPLPEKTPLQATVTGTVEHDEFTVEKLHFQSLSGLYVTGNLYIPKNLSKQAPAIIYVCGHATVEKDGYNYGAKVNYQHHPAWFARHGYVCLILDTLQLAEIEGIHHGLHYFDRWWWLSRGYTPAGVEAWNGIRAIDYLQSRPEVDPEKIGITGRSGGGATSWWVAAVDERIKVAVPVAGITDMEDHVVNGCVEDHCDCMYMFNTYQWDFPMVAALVAPRPLLLSNTDRDPIFPVEGVFRTYRQVRAVYDQMDAENRFALNVTAGPHHDSQELRVHAFRWFNHYLYDREDLIEKPAVKYFTPEQLRVFDELPEDEINTRIDEIFNPVAPAAEAVLDEMSWEEAKARWTDGLVRVFKSWPQEVSPPVLEPQETLTSSDAVLTTFALQSDKHTSLPVFRIRTGEGAGSNNTRLVILDNENWPHWAARLAAAFPGGHFWKDLPADNGLKAELEDELTDGEDLFLVSTRGAGPAKFSGDDKKQAMIRKRYYLLGQSLQTMQTWDILQVIRAIPDTKESSGTDPVAVRANGLTGGMALYASLFADTRLSLQLTSLPVSHMQGPYYLRILRYMDMPAAVLMAGEKHAISLHSDDAAEKKQWEKVIKLADKFPKVSVREGM